MPLLCQGHASSPLSRTAGQPRETLGLLVSSGLKRGVRPDHPQSCGQTQHHAPHGEQGAALTLEEAVQVERWSCLCSQSQLPHQHLTRSCLPPSSEARSPASGSFGRLVPSASGRLPVRTAGTRRPGRQECPDAKETKGDTTVSPLSSEHPPRAGGSRAT